MDEATGTPLYLENRCIAMLDVLGFAEKIKDKKLLLKVLQRYKSIVANSKGSVFVSRSTIANGQDLHKFGTAEFVFDTLILVSRPIAERGSVGSFMLGVSDMMQHFAVNRMPLRGAVGIGDYVFDSESRIFLSDIFKRLKIAEDAQDWAGCILLPEFESEIMPLLYSYPPAQPSRSDVVLRYSVPLKNTKRLDAWCINWQEMYLRRRYFDLLQHYMSGAPNKLENTNEFFAFYDRLPDHRLRLPRDFAPAVHATIVKSDLSWAFTFWNKSGYAVNAPCRWIYHPRIADSLHAFIGYRTSEELRQKGCEQWGPYGETIGPPDA